MDNSSKAMQQGKDDFNIFPVDNSFLETFFINDEEDLWRMSKPTTMTMSLSNQKILTLKRLLPINVQDENELKLIWITNHRLMRCKEPLMRCKIELM